MVTKDMIIKDIVDKYPQALPVFGQFGMGCLGCSGALFESLEQGALAHGIDVEVMLNAINKLVQKQ